jgi:hypothetical protein
MALTQKGRHSTELDLLEYDRYSVARAYGYLVAGVRSEWELKGREERRWLQRLQRFNDVGSDAERQGQHIQPTLERRRTETQRANDTLDDVDHVVGLTAQALCFQTAAAVVGGACMLHVHCL